ncbi:MAG: hypothetical protein P8Y14_26655, partial [Anaerolineales bacterium]
MHRSILVKIGGTIAGLAIFAFLLYQIPSINRRLSWRVDFAMTYVRSVLHPVGEMPTALPQPAVAVTL